MSGWRYRLLGFWIRREACRMVATAMEGQALTETVLPTAWSLAVFFESYMVHGSTWTREEFGPKEPVELTVVETGRG